MFIAGALVAACPPVVAQGYPVKPVRVVVPVAPGGAGDILARAVARRLSAVWNQQVLVDNRSGGGSNIGYEIVSKSAPDGYTLVLANPALTVNVSLYKKLAYDPVRDFAPIILAVRTANVLAAHPAVPVRNLQDLIRLAKAKPGQLTYASSGNGTTPHLSGELFKSMAGINIIHIPYKGGGATIADVLGGQVDMTFVGTSAVVPHIQSGRLRGLATTSAQRSTLLPDLPTFAESGLEGYVVYGWFGFLAPAGTPRELVARLNAEIAKALAHPEVLPNRAEFEPVDPHTPDEFGAYLRADIAKWAKVVQASGARAD